MSDYIDRQRERLEQAMKNRERLRIEMGTAYTMDMEEVPWRAMIRPLAFRQSAEGERVTCEVEAEQLYAITGDNHGEGRRHLLLGQFAIIG